MGGRGASSSLIKNNIHTENGKRKYYVLQKDERTGDVLHWGTVKGGTNFTGQEAFNFIKNRGGKSKNKLVLYDTTNGKRYKYTSKGFVKNIKK